MCTHDTPHNTSFSRKTKKNAARPSAKLSDAHHNDEHDLWNRRSFIQALGLVGGGSMMLGGANLTAAQPSRLTTALANADSDRVLVLIRLKGGNDGLNTIIPIYDYDFYAQNRPTIHYQESELFSLSPDFGIPPALSPLQSLWGDGSMKVIHGVGYPDQNLSHFRSSDIWASAQPETIDDTGILGRYFEELYPDYLIDPPEIPPAIQIGSIGNLLFDGEENNYAFSVVNPQQLEVIAQSGVLHDVQNIPGCTYGEQLGFLRGTINTTFTYAGVIHEAYESSTNAVDYGNGQLAQQLAIVARMIKGGLGTQVYMVTMGSFDTHADQRVRQEALFADLSNTVKNFYDDLAASGMQNEVIATTFSEFGRRIEENGSNGTDHGAASPVLLFGPAVEGQGFVGTHPDLQNPDEVGNPEFTTDFRSIYATLLKDWLCIDGNLVDQVLFGQSFESLDLGFACNTLSTPEFSDTASFVHLATYDNGQTFIQFTLPTTAKVTVTLYNLLGQDVGVLANDFMFEGQQKINIKAKINRRLHPGQYIYRISFGGQHYSRSVLIK